LLDAAILRFLQHNICFRETLGDETLLIFPGLIKQKRPLQIAQEIENSPGRNQSEAGLIERHSRALARVLQNICIAPLR
jgi:hypothetical protein